ATPRRSGTLAHAASVLQDLLDGVAFPKVDRDSSKLPSYVEAFGDVVHDVHLRRPAQLQGAMGGEQTDGAGPEDGDAVALRDLSELGGVVAGGKGVGEQHEIVLPLVTGLPGEAETVGVGERDMQPLGLGPPVR